MAKKTKKTEEITKKFGDERRKALDDALKNIEKDFGKGAVMRLGERAEQKVQVMSSGSLALDIALGAGGYPKGRIIEIYGPESSGKTTVALHAVAQTQKEGGIAGYIFRKAEWSLLRATLTHYALTCLGFIPLATLSGWFPLRLTFYLELVIEFSLIYLLVWVFSYWKMKKDIEQLNQELKHL